MRLTTQQNVKKLYS